MEKGILAGYPMTGVRAILYDGSYHDVDSSGTASNISSSMGSEGSGAFLSRIPRNWSGDLEGRPLESGRRDTNRRTEWPALPVIG